MRKPTRSKSAGKRAKAKKSPAKKSSRRAGGSGRNAALAAVDPAKLEMESRLEETAFDELTPGLNLAAAKMSSSAPFVLGQMRFRLLRAQDLLVIEIRTNGLKFEDVPLRHADQNKQVPHLVAGSKAGSLTAVFGYQHAAEKALDEVTSPPDPPGPGDIPIPARAAQKSRLVFKVPVGEQIPFSIDGIVAAMSRLEMAVAPVATPRVPESRAKIQAGAALVELGGGIGVAAKDGQLFLQNLITGKNAPQSAPKRVAGSVPKRVAATASLIALSQAMHDVRSRASRI
jgi:hypothetical protein